MTININTTSLSTFSGDELISYAEKGLLEADGFCLSELVERVLEDREMGEYKFTQEDVDNAHEEGYRDRVSACRNAIEYL